MINYKNKSNLVFELNKTSKINISINTIQVDKVIHDLKENKGADGDIPVKILRDCGSMFHILKNFINQSLETSRQYHTPPILHQFLKDNPLEKLSYRLVSILPLLSNVYERLIYNQQYEFAENLLVSVLSCFRRAHGTKICIHTTVAKKKKNDNHGFVGTILIDLPKAHLAFLINCLLRN